jgi:hypothetical protein
MNKIGDWFITLLYVAGIFVLVRPGSQGPGLVSAVGTSVSNMVDAATGDVSVSNSAWAAGGSSTGSGTGGS